MLKKRSVTLSGHATSVALEPEFWAVLDAVATASGLSQAGLMKRIDERRGRTPLASACRLLALAWAERRRGWWWCLALTVAAYALGIVLFTRQVNLPLNHLTESWTPATLPADWAGVRDAWNRANLWRSGLSLALFAASLLTLALRLQPPETTTPPQP